MSVTRKYTESSVSEVGGRRSDVNMGNFLPPCRFSSGRRVWGLFPGRRRSPRAWHRWCRRSPPPPPPASGTSPRRRRCPHTVSGEEKNRVSTKKQELNQIHKLNHRQELNKNPELNQIQNQELNQRQERNQNLELNQNQELNQIQTWTKPGFKKHKQKWTNQNQTRSERHLSTKDSIMNIPKRWPHSLRAWITWSKQSITWQIQEEAGKKNYVN